MSESKETRLASPAPSVTSSAETPPKQTPPANNEEMEYPPLIKVVPIMLGLFLTAFLVALDRTIIGTAIPTITNEFNSLGDVGWYASSYLLTMAGFQLFWGRIYTFFNPKYVFLGTIILFEVGSVVCGAAPDSVSFIVGRAVAGLGSAGVFSGAIPIFVRILPLEKRPMWTGMFGMVFGVASVVGPLLGGAFTDNISWRWCFYINLPIGAVAFVVIVFVLKLPPVKREQLSWSERLQRLDFIGTSVFLPAIVCLLLALQWGGVTYAWSDGRIIALLVLFGVLIIAFIGIQIWRKDYATLPPHIVRNRSVAAGALVMFCIGSTMMVFVFYLPIWFQAIKGVSAVKSGIMNIPFVLGLVVATISAGIMTKKIGYYTQWLYVSAVLAPIGAGLITTFTPHTGHAKWIGYQVLLGFGIGIGMQQPSVAAQTVLSQKDVSTGASLMFFMQTLGGSICTSISNNIFDNKLAEGFAHIPGLDVGTVTKMGATELRRVVPAAVLPAVLDVYNRALVDAFYVGLAVTCLIIFGAVAMPFKSIKKSANASKQQQEKNRLSQHRDVEAAPSPVTTPAPAATAAE